jgi:hypothetical protein
VLPVDVPFDGIWRWFTTTVVPLWRGDDDTFPVVGWLSTAGSLTKLGGHDLWEILGEMSAGGSAPLAFLTNGPVAEWLGPLSIAGNLATGASSATSLVGRGNPIAAAADDPLGFTEDASGMISGFGLAAGEARPELFLVLPYDAVVGGATVVYLGAQVLEHVEGLTTTLGGAASWTGDRLGDAADLGEGIARDTEGAISKGGGLLANAAESTGSAVGGFVEDWVPGLG